MVSVMAWHTIHRVLLLLLLLLLLVVAGYARQTTHQRPVSVVRDRLAIRGQESSGPREIVTIFMAVDILPSAALNQKTC